MTHLRKARIERNFTQDELALVARVTQATISRLERNEAAQSGVTLDIAHRLAKALGVEVVDIFPSIVGATVSHTQDAPVDASAQGN